MSASLQSLASCNLYRFLITSTANKMTSENKFDLLDRRKSGFVLWAPGVTSTPQLILGTYSGGKVKTLTTADLSESMQDLWELSLQNIRPQLQDNTVYHYWFQVKNTFPYDPNGTPGPVTITITDPLAYTVDYRTFGDQPRNDGMQPPAVIKFRDGKLWPCDIDGSEPDSIAPPLDVPANNHMVIYELPTSWVKPGENGEQVDRGTFDDVLALFERSSPGDRFASLEVVREGAILSDLGINALELLPIADARWLDAWGYATAHYFAPDADLGSNVSFAKLVNGLGQRRLILDTVMAFGHDPYAYASFEQFHLWSYKPDKPDPRAEPSNPDSWSSNNEGVRDDNGGLLWRYIQTTNTYDPQFGHVGTVHPSWSFHKGHLYHWLLSYGISGLRLDSINNVANYDFIKSYKEYAWQLHQSRGGASDKFLVIGEELAVPKDLLSTGTLNALWNEPFQGRLRAAILGQTANGDDFEYTVRKMIDCTTDGYTDGSQAVNYMTSHDVEHDVAGYEKKRLFNFLSDNKVTDMEMRTKLAFACLLTAVGIPMIFAGEEFCDEMDYVDFKDKQTDPVNWERKNQGWRNAIFDYVATLVRFRQECPALGVDDTNFINIDNSNGRDGRIMAWVRGGGSSGTAPVVVVANFTDQKTPGSQYFVPNWPERDRDDWREVTQGRDVPREWVGQEPLMDWEAKVYTYWKK